VLKIASLRLEFLLKKSRKKNKINFLGLVQSIYEKKEITPYENMGKNKLKEI
jgi:hypothetical protein